MRYFHYKIWTPFCGTDDEGVVAFEDYRTDERVEQYFEDQCYDNAESFVYMIDNELEDAETEKERDEIENNYYAKCGYDYWETDEEDYLEWN